MIEQGTKSRPPRWARRRRGKRRKTRDARAAMHEVVRLREQGFSAPAIAGKVRLPVRLVQDIIGLDADREEGGSR